MKSALEELNCDKAATELELQKGKSQLEKQTEKLSQTIRQLNDIGQDTSELQRRLDILEGKEQQCVCSMQEQSRKALNEEIEKIRSVEQFKTKYDYFEGVIEEVTKTNDKSFNQLLLLTVNSSLPKEEQVKRINESFAEKNKKILSYVSQLL